MLPGKTQVTIGTQVETPDGPGWIAFVRKYEDGVWGYHIFFCERHPRWGDSIGYEVEQLRPLNPRLLFPACKQQVARPAHGYAGKPRHGARKMGFV